MCHCNLVEREYTHSVVIVSLLDPLLNISVYSALLMISSQGRENVLINPWRACARVTVVSCVCVCVCVSVRLLPL